MAMFFTSFVGINNARAEITGQLDLGASGLNVVALQTYLSTDVDIYPSGLVTGYFDSLTQTAIQKFQTAQGIVDHGTPKTTGYGRVGPKTLKRINTFIDATPVDQVQNELTLPIKIATVSINQKPTISGLPMRLEITKIGVNTTVDSVGLLPDGAMDMIKSVDNVAWFAPGPRPGEEGNAVIGGHYNGGKDNTISVFDNLNKLQIGDKLYIKDDNNVTVSFVVREIRIYDQNADATDVFVSEDGKAHLNLITCDGVWDSVSKTYSGRLVVFTDKE